ncbi:MAG TPA: RDD family protein [Candidatus Dormibacteraeota bacterium]|nr:RDD family protein [Candidatus Dormibacteraeota bacterium]
MHTEVLESVVGSTNGVTQDDSWRGELNQRFKAYQTRSRSETASGMQAQFSFEGSPGDRSNQASLAIEEEPAQNKDDFSFTIAVGKASKPRVSEELPMEIDVSARPHTDDHLPEVAQGKADSQAGLYQIAPIDDRRLAGVIDFFCLLFAYGGFLGLFGSLGGHFTLSKLSAAVYLTTFATFYLQYFALFSIFGGTTPGMMMRGLQVASFTGDAPTPRQMLLRSVGYLLSAGTFFLGFLWALWDPDELTWHDRLSRTYLSVEQTLPELETSDAAGSR